MKKLFPLLILLLSGISGLSKTLDLAVFYGTFYSPDQGTYIETYFSLNPRSVVYSVSEGGFSGSVDVLVSLEQNGSIAAAEHFIISLPSVEDTADYFADIVQQVRLVAAPGNYTLRLTVSDLAQSGDPYELFQAFEVAYDSNQVMLSDIQLIDRYFQSESANEMSKSGMVLVPLVPRGEYFLPEDFNSLTFYSEAYNTKTLGDSARFLIKYYLEDYNTGKILYTYGGAQKKSPSEVIPILNTFNISKLKSGQYALNIELVSSTNEVLDFKKLTFYRSNPVEDLRGFNFATVNVDNYNFLDSWTLDSADLYLNCIYPISDYQERRIAKTQLEAGDLEVMKRFFVGFWNKRSPDQPYETWMEYWKVVEYVDASFGTINTPGYRTDLGRVYLQYGAPNNIDRVDSDPRAYPYQIWQYNELNSPSTSPQVNKVFIFANFEIGSKFYELLHSDAREERFNPRWRLQLQQRDLNSANPYNTGIEDRDYMGSKLQNNMIINSGNAQNTNRNYGTSGN